MMPPSPEFGALSSVLRTQIRSLLATRSLLDFCSISNHILVCKFLKKRFLQILTPKPKIYVYFYQREFTTVCTGVPLFLFLHRTKIGTTAVDDWIVESMQPTNLNSG
jgi:hypothetical protein